MNIIFLFLLQKLFDGFADTDSPLVASALMYAKNGVGGQKGCSLQIVADANFITPKVVHFLSHFKLNFRFQPMAIFFTFLHFHFSLLHFVLINYFFLYNNFLLISFHICRFLFLSYMIESWSSFKKNLNYKV